MVQKWQVWSVCLGLGLLGAALPAQAETQVTSAAPPQLPTRDALPLDQLPRPATNVQEWLTQVDAATPRVIGVKIERTATGLDITLETAEGKRLTINATKFRAEGNTLVADIPNAALALPTGQGFVAENPTTDIATVQVVEAVPGTIRVTVAGKEALPKTQVTLKTGGLAYALNPGKVDEDQEVVVTNQQPGYRVPNATTGTKTDTPLRDIPQSIQVIPRQVLEDRNLTRLDRVSDTTPGAQPSPFFRGVPGINFQIRGFSSSGFRDGFRDFGLLTSVDLAGVQQVEILRGPGSVLYGQGGPGGIVNVTSKTPLFNPRYELDFSAGSYSFFRPTVDLTGPLNASHTAAYRLNVAYENAGSFRDFSGNESIFVAPAFTFKIGRNTTLNVNAEFQRYQYTFERAFGFNPLPELQQIPINRFLGEPNFNNAEITTGRLVTALEHRFSENWKLRSAFSFLSGSGRLDIVYPTNLLADGETFERTAERSNESSQNYSWQNEVIGSFTTGFIRHNLLLGVELSRYRFTYDFQCGQVGPINFRNPVYGAVPTDFAPCFADSYGTDALGLYIQDQITFNKQIKLLLGGRFDLARTRNRELLTNVLVQDETNAAFSPRIGLVYQPIQPVSLYASYTRSFDPVLFARSISDEPFQPERGTQYEVGMKVDLLRDRLSLTMAGFLLTRSNVSISDPNNDGFNIQTGEQTSRGFELNLTGQPLPGWNMVLGYAYTNAFISQDTTIPVGDRLANVPAHQFAFFNTYEVPRGRLRGLMVGLGLYYSSSSEASLPNIPLQVPGYFRVDALVGYKIKNVKLQLNINNLTNLTYYTAGDFSPQPPRTFLGQVSVEF
jgi:iron complex outermembrane recepter protein